MASLKIGQPMMRPRPVRWLLTVALCFLYAWKKLRLPRGIWPRQFRGILNNWTDPMFRILIRSRIKQCYPDQPCSLRQPASYAPRASVAPEFDLGEDGVRFFLQNGYLPPFDVFSESEISSFAEEIRQARKEVAPHYGMVTERDHHLSLPTMMEFMRRPAIVERCAQLLGPNLLAWRSQFFYKEPRGKAVQWHQASTYLMEDYLEPVLVPPERDELFQLTVWVAVDPATKANGCLRIVPGTADAIRSISFGGDAGFYHLKNYTLDFELEEGQEVYLEAKPGQAIIFAERTIHGSAENQTDGSRSAFNFRVIRPETSVYPDKRYHRANQVAQKFHLDKWGCVLLRGEDTHGLNRIVVGSSRD